MLTNAKLRINIDIAKRQTWVLSILKFSLSRSIGCNPIELNKIYVPIAQKTTIYKNKENIKKIN